MSRCAADAVQWRNRQAYRLSNGRIEITVLLGGGHIADFRLCGSPINAIWEAPWQTIEPQTFSSSEHASLYGDGPVGKFLSGYTGHAAVVGYFGMPSDAETAQGLPLHGEAASSEWKVIVAACDDRTARFALEVALPAYRLHFRREITLCSDAFTVSITERVFNCSDKQIDLQWVEHAAFGEPFFASGEASLCIPATRGLTWHLDYEGREALPNNLEFRWPFVESVDGDQLDLSAPFVRSGTGFVASLLVDSDHNTAFIAVHNRRLSLITGYTFDHACFPWIALWEENCARAYAPWNGITRVRGVEFGTSPMPLGLDQARKTRVLFDTPVLTSIAGNSRIETQYQLFLAPVPP
ncbi:MAG: hypothetical protein ACRD2S_05505, partial [Terriglobales bacterium]